jgi:two-component system chemotaxis response regulator CheY
MSAPLPRSTILVVDDDQNMLELLRVHLSNAGYQVLLAEDAVDGGHLLVEMRPDLMIVDVSMPYMTGYEFVQAVKADPATNDIPVIFLSANDDLPEQAKKLGAAGYLKKPVMANHLLDLVASTVASK